MRQPRKLHSSTRKRIDFLTRYIHKHYQRWFEKYGEQLTGIWVGKKRKGRKTKNYYSIIFNVVEKKDETQLPPQQLIPKYFKVKFPDGRTRFIKTDVRPTGHFQFQSSIGDRVRDSAQAVGGSLGLILHRNHLDYYGLTNYHVAADRLLGQQITRYDASQGDPRHDVEVGNSMKRLYKGIFGNDLDVAAVYLGAQQQLTNRLPYTGLTIDNRQYIEGPFDASLIHQTVTLYLQSQPAPISRPVKFHEGMFRWGTLFRKLVQIDLCTRHGDSGSIVVMNRNQVLGIVIGGDDDSTFIIPFYKIYPFFNLNIL